MAHHPTKWFVPNWASSKWWRIFPYFELTAASLKLISTVWGFDALLMAGCTQVLPAPNSMVSNGAQTFKSATYQVGNQNGISKTKKNNYCWGDDSNSGRFILRNTRGCQVTSSPSQTVLSRGDHVTQSAGDVTSCFLWEGPTPGVWQGIQSSFYLQGVVPSSQGPSQLFQFLPPWN